ncbi:septum formation initiator [Micromonospora noduli]|uniref:septum formation initiator n=1 Tax=Micromonospora noduli TaxID=709876 RepID=UPI000DC0065A|nr:septum formation initiator [Micromonospora noduli]KAB1928883.1 septum formation initiator [Micromonospora noduli]RAN96876.1 Non-specific serine/threonine protein kinase [Micromonospora noduli]RAO19520.1 Non-specific serine/threonine protein kinase [Micromonospora noduli]RAO26934.1 Non-specific serine/threonine protein kinase [Micromonospora noduli]
MGRRSILVATGWVATAAIATVIGLGAIRLVGESLTGTPGGVRSEAEIERALAAPEPAPTTSTTSAAPGTTGTTGTAPSASSGVRRGFATDGGTAVAECGVGGVRLVSWAPAQGYRVRDVDRGPDDDVEVTFQGATREYELKVRCIGSEPVAVADD